VTPLKHVIAAVLILGGATGLVSPDDGTNEELIDSLAAAAGVLIEFFTSRIDRKLDKGGTAP
jgi:hypothetical protein